MAELYRNETSGGAPTRLPLRASSYGHEPVEWVASIRTYDRSARIRRATAASLPMLGGALVSVFIPGWHFVGVPGFLIAAWLRGFRRLRQTRSFESLEGPCPACGDAPGLSLPSGGELPPNLPCQSCGEFLRLAELR